MPGPILTRRSFLSGSAALAGATLTWDAEHETIAGDDDAARWLVRPYRAPWDRELRALGVV